MMDIDKKIDQNVTRAVEEDTKKLKQQASVVQTKSVD